MPKENNLIADYREGQVASTWYPEQGWLMLKPVELPSKTEAGLHLPESFRQKTTSGVCLRMYGRDELDLQHYLGKEVFFPAHSEYRILDSDTGELFYIVPINSVILTRVPPPKPTHYAVEGDRSLRGEGDGMSLTRGQHGIATLQHSAQPENIY